MRVQQPNPRPRIWISKGKFQLVPSSPRSISNPLQVNLHSHRCHSTVFILLILFIIIVIIMKTPFCIVSHVVRSCNKSLGSKPHVPKIFHRIHTSSSSNTPTYSFSPTYLNHLLNTITQTRSIRPASQILAQIIINNCTIHPFLFNNLLNFYSKCGQINQSLLIFSNTPSDAKHIVTWTCLITQLCHSHKPIQALEIFNQMRTTGVYPNDFTFSIILPACADTMIIAHGEQMHSLICKDGFVSDLFVGSALVDMYAKCSNMDSAMRMFVEMPHRNLVSWNAVIVGFAQNKLFDWAIEVFRDIIKENSISPDQVSFSSSLSSCANMSNSSFGRQVHGVAVKHGLIELDYVKNSLLDMYSKCGCFEDAMKLFRTMEDKDVVTWNVMAMGWVQNDCFEEACNCFCLMRSKGIFPSEASLSTALHAAANLAALDQGMSIHDQVIKFGFMANASIGSSLVNMYGKCGSLFDAHLAFEEIQNKNVVCWTAIIAASQQHGCGCQVIELFEKMLAEGNQPDYITFVSVLAACSHAGKLDEGFRYFDSISSMYGMKPGLEHYACMVDMLGRAGRLDEAQKFIESMPVDPDSSILGALLGACRNYGNLEMAKEVAERLFEIEPENSGNYVLLSNLYACYGKSQEGNRMRRIMAMNGLKKEPGCSWIDIKNKTYVFTVHDKSHPCTVEIYEILRKLAESVKKKGYVADTRFAVNSVGEYKEKSLWHHSEKLALAFGLLSLPDGAPIRIKKNLRTCGDCHTVMKLASEIFGRDIIVRDINRFHIFSNGLCCCGDYW